MDKPRFIVVLNGPPTVGKDTLGECLAAMRPDVRLAKLASPLHTTAAAFGHEDKNEVGWSGMTGREFRIWLSEKVCKRHFGQQVFGAILANKLTQAPYAGKVVIVTDGGFFKELDELADIIQTPMLLVRLYRDGLTFDGDSRDYVKDHPVGWWESHDFTLTTGASRADARQLDMLIAGAMAKLKV